MQTALKSEKVNDYVSSNCEIKDKGKDYRA